MFNGNYMGENPVGIDMHYKKMYGFEMLFDM